MKLKIILFGFSLLFSTGMSFAQKGKAPKSIISERVTIKKYYNREELDRLNKGDLIVLYAERIEVLVKTLPYVAFATKPGITMSSLGIPNNSDNVKALDNQFEATNTFLLNTNSFHRDYLPYSDTRNLIAAILYYEEIMKSLHQYSDFN